MCIRDSGNPDPHAVQERRNFQLAAKRSQPEVNEAAPWAEAVSYTHLRAHETVLDLVCRLLLEKKKHKQPKNIHISLANTNALQHRTAT